MEKMKKNWLPIILAAELVILAVICGAVGWKIWSIRSGKDSEATNAPVTEEVVQDEVQEDVEKEPEKTEEELWEEELMERISELTLEEKVAQLFIVTPEQITGVQTATVAGVTTQNAINDYPVGGMIYFAKNLVSKDQTRTLLENTQQYAQERLEVPMLFLVDEGANQGYLEGVDVPEKLVVEVQSGELEVDGVVISDVQNTDETVVEALNDGADMLLMPVDFQEAYWSVISAVESDEISEERVDESVLRIWNVKVEKE